MLLSDSEQIRVSPHNFSSNLKSRTAFVLPKNPLASWGLSTRCPRIVVRVAHQLFVLVPLEVGHKVALVAVLCLRTNCSTMRFFTMVGVALEQTAVDVFALTVFL